jgi:hypothetical protein
MSFFALASVWDRVEALPIQRRLARPADMAVGYTYAVHMASFGLCPARFQESDFGADIYQYGWP